jgi:hypothetical protein
MVCKLFCGSVGLDWIYAVLFSAKSACTSDNNLSMNTSDLIVGETDLSGVKLFCGGVVFGSVYSVLSSANSLSMESIFVIPKKYKIPDFCFHQIMN